MEKYQSNHGTAGNREVSDFVNSTVREMGWKLRVSLRGSLTYDKQDFSPYPIFFDSALLG